MVAQGDAERNPGDKADDVSDVGHVGVVAGDQAGIGDHDDVVEKVDDRHQSLRREEEPGKLERSHQHDASRQREDRSRGPEYSRATGQKGQAEEEAGESADKKDHEELAWADGFLQRAPEDEEKNHVSEKVQDAAVDEEGSHKGPEPALHEVVEAEDEVVLGEHRLLLPGPDAGPYAGEYQE